MPRPHANNPGAMPIVRSSPPRLGRLLLAARCALGAIAVAGCAPPGAPSARAASASRPQELSAPLPAPRSVDPHAARAGLPRPSLPALDELHRRAARERDRPISRAQRAAPPPGIDPSLLAPADALDSRARQSLDGAVAELGASSAAPASPPGAPARSDPPDPDSIRLYAAGRAALLEGNAERAEESLLAAAAAAPQDASAAPIWRTLGEARLARGASGAALLAFRRALGADPDDLRSLEQVGRAAVRSRDWETGAVLLSRAWRRRGALASPDAAIPFLVARDLGIALAQTGRLGAAAEALRVALGVPEPFSAPTSRGAEVGALLRERADMWRETGDLLARLARYADALDAYDLAAQFPSLDDAASLTPRRVFAALRLGSPSAAVLAPLEDILAAQGPAPPHAVAALAHGAPHLDQSRLLVRAIDEIEASFDAPARLRAASSLALARAAVQPRADALETLRARLGAAPADAGAVGVLLNHLQSDPGALLRETIRLTTAAPRHEPLYRRALLARAHDSSSLLAAFERLSGAERAAPAAALLRARLLQLSDADAGLDALATLVGVHPDFLPARVALTESLWLLGRDADAEAALARIDPDASPDARLARAAALGALGRPAEALETLRPLVAQPPDDADLLLLGASLARATNESDLAFSLLERALDADPTREEAHGALIDLLAGPLREPSGRRITEAVRALRAALPGSRTLRSLAARELIGAGQLDRAETLLIDLAQQDPTDPVAVPALVSVWLSTGSTDRAVEWLRVKSAERPASLVLASEYARALVASDRAQEGEALLRDWLARRPGDAGASRALEALLRDALGRPGEAADLALARLDRAPPTLDTALEKAEVLVGARRLNDVAAGLERAPRDARPTPQQASRIVAVLRGVLAIADEHAGSPVAQRNTLAALEALFRLAPSAPLEAHTRRIDLLALTGADAGLIRDAADLAGLQHETLGADARLLALEALRGAGRTADAIALARETALARRPASGPVLAAWIGLGAIANDPGAAEEAVRLAATDARSLDTMISLARMRGDNSGEEAPSTPAELAYAAGQLFATDDHDESAERLWRVALEFDPRHAMANNNIGYRLAEDGENLDEAHAMLVIAHLAAPDEPAITDSLGWVRYRLGIVTDRLDADGAVVLEGAVTLLRSVADGDMPRGAEPEIFDHYGDALWAAGEKDAARRAWAQSSDVARRYGERLREQARDDVELNRILDRLRAIGENAGAKARAAAAGEAPGVAPILGDGAAPAPNVPPPPDKSAPAA